MNISKALKVKNRLAGQLKELESRAQRHNCSKENDESSIDMNEVWKEMDEVRTSLVSLKGAIALATCKITPKLVELAELKSEIKFYEGITINEGSARDYDGDKIVSVKYVNYIKESDKNQAINSLQKKIDNLQDEVDECNAMTTV